MRAAVLNGEGQRILSPISTKEPCRRRAKGDTSLAALVIAREERRSTNQRREDRHRGVVDRATLVFRRKKSLVPVINVSTSGVMIESAIVPRIGEALRLEFEGFDPIDGVVRWVKQGRIGIDVGEGAISLE
jgi:hypothetical protein